MYYEDFYRAQEENKAEERHVEWEVLEMAAEADGWPHETYEAMAHYLYEAQAGNPVYA